MKVTPDNIIYWQKGFFVLNATIVFTWIVMGLLLLVSWLATRTLRTDPRISYWQNFLESIFQYIRNQIREVLRDEPSRYLPFLGTLFLFISLSNFLTFVPGYQPPTGSLSTTGALAVCVFFAVPLYGIMRKGVPGYLKHYFQPTWFMFPFHVISEISRTLALAIRLFGNIMSGTLIAAILISVVPLFLPVVMQAFGLLIGQIHAYIFAVLALVYIASGSRTEGKQERREGDEG
ncbi:MAG: F0F1 ATP synthase subunit A [Candidatus Omnitrophica bacterium]|nr:F0F1 ATP synthase subunit A [Candidatus Omnitrophota bacterium]